jgi:hypothetical protein
MAAHTAERAAAVTGGQMQRAGRQRDFDRELVALYTEGGDHEHVAVFRSSDGRGWTTPGPDGHVHRVRDLEVDGCHGHELSTRRSPWRGSRNPEGPDFPRFARLLLGGQAAALTVAHRRRQ